MFDKCTKMDDQKGVLSGQFFLKSRRVDIGWEIEDSDAKKLKMQWEKEL